MGVENFKWTEANIARALAMQTFDRKYIVMVPNCNWTGYECDLLAVAPDLRIVDIEVKISRADLKADAKKSKWWHSEFKGYGEVKETFRHGSLVSRTREAIHEKTARVWPPKVWKHYYAMPASIWKAELLDSLPSKSSGVILLRLDFRGKIEAYIERRATPNKDAEKISPGAAVDIARLASLRMWNAIESLNDQSAKEAA
jgi:hypothetical protein